MKPMANKQQKKRNKVYRGVDAALTRPVITKISAANRNPISQWWFEHKRIARPIIIAVAILAAVVILVIEIVRITTNG